MSQSISSIKIFSIIVIFLNILGNSNTKPLTKDVFQYLEADKKTYSVYKEEYKKLACKLLTYSRMKNLYDEEVIDVYLKQTDNKMGYLNLLQSTIKEKCIKTLSNNMEIFELDLYVRWNEEKKPYVDVDLNSLLSDFNKTQTEVKSDL